MGNKKTAKYTRSRFTICRKSRQALRDVKNRPAITSQCVIECQTDVHTYDDEPLEHVNTCERSSVEECNQPVATTSQDDDGEDECLYDIERVLSPGVSDEPKFPTGRRIFQIDLLFAQIFNGRKHGPMNCTIADMIVLKEERRGLKSVFHLLCKVCGKKDVLYNELDNTDAVPINNAVVVGTVSTGIGHSQCEQLLACMDVPFMSFDTYQHCHQNVGEKILECAWRSMEEAGKEECSLARNLGQVTSTGVPLLTVVTDGAWSKRSYNINYDALSGVAFIIGQRTGKILFLGIRNKYCCICARIETLNLAPHDHKCFKNWNSSSTAMEADIIVEGFRRSIELHGAIYNRMVGDGDSSVYKKVLQSKPYGTLLVEKVECRNHLLRNFCTKLRDITKRNRSLSKNLHVLPQLRKTLLDNIPRIRKSIVCAVKHHCKSNDNYDNKVECLETDLNNVYSHVFGEHAKCTIIGYFHCTPKADERNLLPSMADCGLLDDLKLPLQRLLQHIGSLLLNMDTNIAEQYNNIVCKFVGGKRVNFSQKGSYETRCLAAAISFNAKGNYYSTLYDCLADSVPVNVKKLNEKHKKKRMAQRLRKKFMKKRKAQEADENYGAQPEDSDLSPEQYKTARNEFLNSLCKTNSQILEIEKETIGQSTNHKWKQERSYRLTASHFGDIYKMRDNTSCQNKVKQIVYNEFAGNKHTRYGNESEPFAITDFEKQYKVSVKRCGLFIDFENPFLAASPDGLILEHDAIIEIKCPSVSKELHPADAIQQKKITFATIDDDDVLTLKRNHAYYHQIQGQLKITRKDTCFFVVWSKKGLLVEKISADPEFWDKMFPKLQIFYYNCLLPELVDPRYPRNLPIRNLPRDKCSAD